ncbi:hypothetical protein [Kaistella jeonii]|uniref:Lipoprotein n=1 Tax=Kaistella jeonii TaxID=266749 RepID=A0A0C1F790_9FLAO|nr:hypothetical protein [Kaistella jeonii]KIA83949.1 hypothetical protein OA86_14925 [Kaistella jeonii]SFC43117.1 hypothetical protein SAMN05421876_1224 [Kaistella jeonii]VEI96529.1 Uncharacterised protein [Kaistella jeonii]
MNIKTIFFYFLIGTILSCKGQKSDKPIQIFDNNTGFKMNLPEGFEEISANESKELLNDGKEKIDQIYDTDIDISDLKPKLFRVDDNNYFLVNITDYDPKIDGDYINAVNESNRLLYRTYIRGFEKSKIDSLNQQKKIGNVDFTKYSLSINIPPKTKMKVINYTSFVKNKDLTIAVVYLDENIGNKVINAIESAKFDK